ncbi:LysM peptidoglycan-binding domain-containing protein [Chryseobacterium herbae]|uniref:LysM domain-containing protein n=1 Tax=Chryseobacterium herbae TaxID=2976476 RepID=A0ABT2IQ07_9FLAO|nr:LysM domain-containing protein [Chryseobacterium sp. pc1-10]MCT2560898.1 LysM domain-containing protein [Chryseobacterium sp. pc1-10]
MDFFEYKVRNGDTLYSIASRLGMTAEELKLYHNSRCKRIDTVWFENLNGVQHLFVPLNFKTEKQTEEEKKKILPPAQLSNSFFLPIYHITETFENPMEDSLAIDYTVQVGIHRCKTKNHYVLTFNQKDFKTNDEIPDDKAGSLSLAFMESIMPIGFSLSDTGNITGFADHKSAIEKFKEKRTDLEEFFIGDVSKIYFDTFQDNISDREYFLRQFKSTLLFQTLFPKMDWFHKRSTWSEKFFFIQNSFPVQCCMEIEYEDEDSDFIITVLRGKITDSCSLQELKRGIRFEEMAEEPVSGEISLQYTTHKHHKNLSRAESSLSLWHEDALIQKHNITITQ